VADAHSASWERPSKADQIRAILGPDVFAWAVRVLPAEVSIDDVRYRDLVDVTEDEVLAHALENGFDRRAVWTDGDPSPADDRTCLTRHRQGWRVYYTERGQISDDAVFATYEEACREVARRRMRLARILLNQRYWHAHGLAFPCDVE